uniref:Uncharacterized protein n=1 Tax=Anguilla anguilla TaxID=7936 RepID=A0A0E9PX37_ANGAN
MRRELTNLYSPSYLCSITVYFPMGLRSLVRKSPEISK